MHWPLGWDWVWLMIPESQHCFSSPTKVLTCWLTLSLALCGAWESGPFITGTHLLDDIECGPLWCLGVRAVRYWYSPAGWHWVWPSVVPGSRSCLLPPILTYWVTLRLALCGAWESRLFVTSYTHLLGDIESGPLWCLGVRAVCYFLYSPVGRH